MPEPDVRCVATVRGLVQGVGFRWWTRHQLELLGLTGSARNLDDGSVEIVAGGNGAAIDRLLAAVRGADAPGRVTSVEVSRRTAPRAQTVRSSSPPTDLGDPMPSALPSPATLPPSVQVGPGEGGLAVVRVDGRAGSAEIYLHGAHVTSWAPAGAAPVLWMSAVSRYVPESPLRGGVPICFPWFGSHATDPAAPAHGFARLTDWELVEAHEDGDDVVVSFRLVDSDATRASAWPHRFEARYTVTVGARLGLALRVTNLDAEPVTFEEALHTYLRVVDITATEVTGLEHAPYFDRLGGPAPHPGETGPVRFAGETDRIYLGTRAAVTVVDGEQRRVTLDKRGSDATVVWNPSVAKSAAMADFGDDEWREMVCVETCNLRDDAVHLAPGQSHTMSVVISDDPA